MNARASGPPGGAGFRLVGFPKEFERNFWETFDRRYYSIFLITFIVLYSFAYYMAHLDWSLSEDQIAALKKRVIEKVYDVELLAPTDEPEEEEFGVGELATTEEPQEVSERGKERVEESQTQKVQRRRRTQADLESRSRQMQAEVASQGILAVATSAGGSGAGNVAYSDVLKGISGSGVGDIGEVVQGTAGIRTAGSGEERTRAAKGSGFRREGGGTGIDDLISGESVAGGASFGRRGKIELASENVEVASGAGNRDPEGITAAINKQSSSVEYCYQKSAKVNPSLHGRIDLEIEIAANGRVTRVRATKSTLDDKRLESCIVRAVRRWRFGAIDGGSVRIRVPFIF